MGSGPKGVREVVFQRLGLKANLTVYSDPLKTQALLTIVPSEKDGAPPSAADVMDVLSQASFKLAPDVQSRVDQALAAAAGGPIPEILVAEGKAPTKGHDAEAHWFVDMAEEMKTEVNIVGDQADYRNIREIAQVKADDPVLEIVPATRGEPGVNISAEAIDGLMGDELKLQFGENVRFDADTRVLRAKAAGRVRLRGNTVWVDPIFRVEGDVSYESGNVNFEGDVVVAGSIEDGFEVKAAKNVVVFGSVFAGSIEAGGDITIHEGISGRSKGKLTAGGTLSAKYMKDVTIRVGGDLRITSEIFASTVRVNGKIFANRGAIVGGDVVALRGIEVGMLGSAMLVPTRVTLGLDPDVEKRVKDLRAQVLAVAKQTERIYLNIKPYVDDAAAVARLPESRKDWVRSLLQSMAMLREQKAAAEKELQGMDAPTIPIKDLRLHVGKSVFAKVTVTMGNIVTTFDGPVDGPVTLYADEENKRIVPRST